MQKVLPGAACKSAAAGKEALVPGKELSALQLKSLDVRQVDS